MALGASVYKLIFDTQGLESVTASRRELALSKKIMEETTPAVDKLAQAEAHLDRMMGKGLITHEQRNQVLAKTKAELMGQTAAVDKGNAAFASGAPAIGKYATALVALGPAGVAAAVAIMGTEAAMKLAGAAIRTTVDAVTEQIGKIDDLVNASETIGIAVDQYQTLAHAADLADISQDKFSGGIEKMLVGISKGADGSTKLVDAFNLIELDVRKLSEMKPEKAFRNITDALDRIPNSADRVRAATAIFGSADFLRVDTSHIDRASTLMERLRANLDEADASIFGEFDANTKDLNKALDVTVQKLAMEIVPALADAGALATEWLVSLNQSKEFTDALHGIGDALTVTVAVAREVPAVIETWMPAIDAVLTGFEAMAPTLALAARLASAAGMDMGEAAGKSNADIAEQARRKRDLDAQLRARQAPVDSGKPVGVDDTDSDFSSSDKAREAADKFTESLQDQIETFGMTARMSAVYRAEMENNGRINVEGRQAAALLDQMEKEKKLREDASKATEDSAKKAEAAEKRRADARKNIVDGLDSQIRKLEQSEREQLKHALVAEEAGEKEVAAALDKFDKIQALEKDRDEKQKASEQRPLQVRAGVIKVGTWEWADAMAEAQQRGVLARFKEQEKKRIAAERADAEKFNELFGELPVERGAPVPADKGQAAGKPIPDDKGEAAVRKSSNANEAMDRHSKSMDGFVDAIDRWIEHGSRFVGEPGGGGGGGAPVGLGAPVGAGNLEQPAGATTITGPPIPSDAISDPFDAAFQAFMKEDAITKPDISAGPRHIERDVISQTPEASRNLPQTPKVEPAKMASPIMPQTSQGNEKGNAYLAKIVELLSKQTPIVVEEVTLS